ncbi:hypothetical protein ACGFK1_19405 [Mycobacterium sp. NPDC048908]|uniref:hypothetical protein n=1 Tax=Mycobacterium sp. NPDC048908 TaxID=3364292 RepID=UPI00371BCD89
MRISSEMMALTVASGALSMALTLGAPTALADPAPVIPPPPAPSPADPAVPTPGPAPDATLQAAAGTLPTPPDGTQHLSSPENLPPGTTDTPDPTQGRGSYLRDLWHAYQTQEITGRDALLLLTQRPMNANPMPPAGMPVNPTPPPAPGAEPAPAPPPPLVPWLAPPAPPAP